MREEIEFRSIRCDTRECHIWDVLQHEVSFSFPSQNNSPANMRRANMVKKSMQYFSDKKNRSLSEDNLFTRRKNLAVHLGLDEKVSLREIQV